TDAALRGLVRIASRVIAYRGRHVRLADYDIGPHAGYQLPYVFKAKDAVVVRIGDVEMRHVAGGVQCDARVGAAGKIDELKLSALDEIRRIAIVAFLAEEAS